MIRLITVFLVKIYALLFYRHRVYGKHHFPKGGGMICSNHTSFLDPPLIGISCPGVVHFLGRDTLFRSRFFGWFIGKLNCHPVRRGKGNAYAFKKALQLIQKGNKVVIFPEGRRSTDGELNKGQLGVSMLVQRAGCQVVPVYIHGAYNIWNTKRRFPKIFGKTACIFGRPLTFQDLDQVDKKQAQAEIADRIMSKIGSLRDWYLAGAKGSPP
ncbi:MAG: 1-acyl-sn-glycerol-3-phosphate acyltransferase [Chlamydiales bacterium]|nr:1-acyl-sn-glycerol-3-phosphate acyltransferase [Chlamydiales bacterium]